MLKLGDAIVNVNGSDLEISLADMGITEEQYEEVTQDITWESGYGLAVRTGSLEPTADPDILYSRMNVTPGTDVRLRGWFTYGSVAYSVFDASDNPLTWDVGHQIPYVTQGMFITLDFTIPPDGSYMVVCNYNPREDS